MECQLSETCSSHTSLPKPTSPSNILALTNKTSTFRKPTCPKIFTYLSTNIYRIKLLALQVACHQFYKIRERIAMAEERHLFLFDDGFTTNSEGEA